MLELLFYTPFLLLYAALFGITMKIADLLDEHGLKWFRGAPLLFGVLWGGFGALMMVGNNILTNFLLALLIHWIIRYRIDYFNHGIAAAIMLVTFVYLLPGFEINWTIFLVILIVYSIHGLSNDMVDQKRINGWLAKYFGSNSHYFTVPIILVIINPAYWIILAVSAIHMVCYETTKYFGMKHLAK